MKAGRAAAAGAVSVAALLAFGTGAAGSAGKRHGHAAHLSAVSTGNHSELVKKVPITRRSLASPRVVMSLTPARLPRLHAGDRLVVNAEAEVTTTCVLAEPRCIGRPYRFSPSVGARLVLSPKRRLGRGPYVTPISSRQRIHCSQDRPNRNHHCVIVFGRASTRMPGDLPCRPSRCFVNLVVDAHNPRARRGNVLIIGADRPNGSIAQDMGRLNAVVIPRGVHAHARRLRTSHRVTHRIPMGSPGSGGERVVYSLRVPNLRRGDALLVRAKEGTGIGSLSYSAFVASEVILAGNRHATRPSRHSPARQGGDLTERNGFNCTQGASAYRTPCITRKAGIVAIKRSPPHHHGHPRPVFVNLLTRSFPKLATARPGDAARVSPGGYLAVIHFRRRS